MFEFLFISAKLPTHHLRHFSLFIISVWSLFHISAAQAIDLKSTAFCEFALDSNNLITLDNPIGANMESNLKSIFTAKKETPLYKRIFSKSASTEAESYILKYLYGNANIGSDFVDQLKLAQARYKSASTEQKTKMQTEFQRDIRAAKTRIKNDQQSMIKYLNDYAELNSMQNFFFTLKAYQNRIAAIYKEVQRLIQIAIVTEDSNLLVFATKLQIDGELFFVQFKKSPLAKLINPFDFYIYFSNLQPRYFVQFNYYDSVYPDWYSILQSPFYLAWFRSKENLSLMSELNNPANTNYDLFSQFALNHSILFYGHLQNIDISKVLILQLHLLASPINRKKDMERLFDQLFEVPAVNQYLGAALKPYRDQIINQAMNLKLNLP
jgi:hypothetical protein